MGGYTLENQTPFKKIVIATIVFTASSMFVPVNLFAGGLSHPTAKMPVKTTDDDTSIGQVAWEITEPSTGNVVSTGERTVKMTDVQVIEGRSGDYLEQRLPLSDGFYLKLNSGRNNEPFSGFGITAGKEDEITFSWEWFNVVKPGIARKLQETGELEFDSMQIGSNHEITRLRFATDISLRVMKQENTDVGGFEKPDWRVKILENSEIKWPTIAGGKVQPATDAAAWRKANPPPPGFWSSLVKAAENETSQTE